MSAPTARERAPILTMEFQTLEGMQGTWGQTNEQLTNYRINNLIARRAFTNQALEGMQRAKADTSYIAFSEEQILNGETGYRVIRTKTDGVDDYSVMSGDSLWGWGYESQREAAMAISGHLKTRSEFQLPPNALYQENWHLPGLRSMMWTAANEGSNDWFLLSKEMHLLNRYAEEALSYNALDMGKKDNLPKVLSK